MKKRSPHRKIRVDQGEGLAKSGSSLQEPAREWTDLLRTIAILGQAPGRPAFKQATNDQGSDWVSRVIGRGQSGAGQSMLDRRPAIAFQGRLKWWVPRQDPVLNPWIIREHEFCLRISC
ncbi:MAG: hypothetical protein ACRESZ_07750 [Methylococcales bacterium]